MSDGTLLSPSARDLFSLRRRMTIQIARLEAALAAHDVDRARACKTELDEVNLGFGTVCGARLAETETSLAHALGWAAWQCLPRLPHVPINLVLDYVVPPLWHLAGSLFERRDWMRAAHHYACRRSLGTYQWMIVCYQEFGARFLDLGPLWTRTEPVK